MSVKDFYNAVTPGSTLTHGVGRGSYCLLGKDDICSERIYQNEKVPTDKKGRYSMLNEVTFSVIQREYLNNSVILLHERIL